MTDLLNRISQAGKAAEIVLRSGAESLSRAELLHRVDELAERLRPLHLRGIALYSDNSIEWIVTDLACRELGIRIVPIPLFFSPQQINHTLAGSGVEALVTDQDHASKVIEKDLILAPQQPYGGRSKLYFLDADESALIPDETQKITFTSGTTGTPKGVCLSAAQQLAVAESIATTVASTRPRHLCVLPLSTLLENLAGVYSPLLSGGSVTVPPLADVGLAGSSGLDINTLLKSIDAHQPNTLILVPELLNAVTAATECGWRPPSSLHFVAVGGGKVSPALLQRARAAGLPAYEGYGLSECASVVSLNVPGADRAGSVGRPLPHVAVSIDAGEIVVSGSVFLGYTGQPESWCQASVRTGDLGHIDDDGFVVVSGRAKNQIISSFGRNISPEWVESELTAGTLLQQAVVIGDDKPFCIALVHARNPATTSAEIEAWIRAANQRLPDYARVLDWYRLPEPNSPGNGLMTESGKPKRTAIEQHYEQEIEQMYALGKEASNQ